eukprot:s1760_g20.t1
MSETAGAQPSGSTEEKASNLWSLLPSFDRSTDSAKEYSDKVKFLWGICPSKDRGMLAPRLALLCKGTAWSQVKSIASEKLTDPESGYKVLLKALESWEEAEELQTFDKFEKAFYRVVQKADESAMSFVNRINVAFDEVGVETTVKQVRAFVMLRQSALNSEDKKRVVSMAGSYELAKVESAMRSLSTKVLGQSDMAKKKVYPANFVEDDAEEINYTTEDEVDEEQVLAALIEEGDETALAIQEFEDQVIHVCQDSPELAMAFSSYQEARQKLRDRVRSRGFWPLRNPKGRGKGKYKKGKGAKKYQSLAERIANSTCRACGARGHWKDECPLKDKNVTADVNVILSEETYGEDELLDELPGQDLENWQLKWLNSKLKVIQRDLQFRPTSPSLTAMAFPSGTKMVGSPYPGLNTELLDVVLQGEVDATLAFEQRQMPEIKCKRPPGVMTLREWGQLSFPDGKWKGHSFAKVYKEDPKYAKYMQEHKKLVSAWAMSFQAFVNAMSKMEEECSASFYQEYARQLMKAELAKIYPKPETVESRGPEWEVLTGSVTSSPSSSVMGIKRPMEEENTKMATDVTQKEEKITRMAILQREMDKIKSELESV